jgi:hypothetical protein
VEFKTTGITEDKSELEAVIIFAFVLYVGFGAEVLLAPPAL